jgi:hypothetical protein
MKALIGALSGVVLALLVMFWEQNGTISTMLAAQNATTQTIILQQAEITALQGGSPATASLTAARKQACPLKAERCVITPYGGTGELDVASAYGLGGTPLLVTDHYGAAMFAVNINGAFSFGAPGYAGGLLCTTRKIAWTTCLLPDKAGVAFYSAQGRDPVVLTRWAVIKLLRKGL